MTIMIKCSVFSRSESFKDLTLCASAVALLYAALHVFSHIGAADFMTAGSMVLSVFS